MRVRTDSHKEWAREHARAKRSENPELHRQRVKASRAKAISSDPNFYKKKDLARFYGVTFEWYQETLVKQNYSCAICKKHQDQNTTRQGKPLALAVDHCHSTGVVRGLLCNNCNREIGMLQHDIAIIQAAQAYLNNQAGLLT
jgi:hypothetical protein